MIKESDWATFTTREPMIAYIPKKRQLIVVDDNTSTGDGNIFLYDLVTQSWVQGSDATITSQNLTNFATDWNGDLIYAHTNGTVVKWDDSPDLSTATFFATKDIDFGQPGQRKKVYKVYISYKGNASVVNVRYAVNGESDLTTPDFYQFSNPSGTIENTPLSDKSSSENLESWHIAGLKPAYHWEANDIYSFRLIINGTVDATFEINDISIVYRMKNVR